MTYILVDVEACGGAPGLEGAAMTEFGAVEFNSRQSFHGRLWDAKPSAENPAIPVIVGDSYDHAQVARDFQAWLMSFDGRLIFVSDNNGYDFMWMAHFLQGQLGHNPFGHSSRRIGDIYSGLATFWSPDTPQVLAGQSAWKKWRVTPHTHNPVDDAMGNVEALHKICEKFNVTLP